MAIDISRRCVLAAGGGALTTLLAGCGTLPFVDDGGDDVDGTDWPMAAHDARNTNRTAATLPDEPTEQWRASVGGWTPTVADGTAYLVSPDSNISELGSTFESSTIHALDTTTGEKEWTESLPDSREFRNRPTVGDGAVIYGTAVDEGPVDTTDTPQGVLHAREMDGGEERWQVDPAPSTGWGWSTIVGDTLLAAGTRGERVGWVGAFEAASGDRLWDEELDIWTYGPPATDGDVVVAITVSGNVFALDADSGERLRTYFDNPAEVAFQPLVPPALGDEAIFVLLPATNAPEMTLYALDREVSAETVWQRTVPGRPPRKGSPLFTLGLADERVLCLTKEGYLESTTTTRLTAFDRDSGDERWTYTVPSDGRHDTGQLTLTEESALFAADGRLHAVSLAGEKRWERSVDEVESAKPIVADGRLYLDVTAADEEGTSLAAFA